MDYDDDYLADDASVRAYLKPLNPWLRDDDMVTEICINRPGEIFVERPGQGWERIELPALTLQHLEQLAVTVATYTKQDISMSRPILSASMPDGERMQIVRPPACERDTVSITIRKPARFLKSVDDFERDGLFSQIITSHDDLTNDQIELLRLKEIKDYSAFIRLAVRSKQNIVVCGATGSGKTTFMKGIIQLIPEDERLVTIEDVSEIVLPRHPNHIHLFYSKGGQGLANVTSKQLLESCLRMKPDRILLAELRGEETFYYIRNAASGHPGSMTSCHAGSTAQCFEQLALMVKESEGGRNLEHHDIKRLLYMTIDVVLQFRNENGVRFISELYYDPKKKSEAMG